MMTQEGNRKGEFLFRDLKRALSNLVEGKDIHGGEDHVCVVIKNWGLRIK